MANMNPDVSGDQTNPDPGTPWRSRAQDRFTAFTGRLMLIFGWTGVVFSLILLVSIPPGLKWLAKTTADELQAMSGSLRGASETLEGQLPIFERVDNSLQQAHELSSSIDESLDSARVLMDDLAEFLTGPLDTTLEETEASLRYASDGAAAIDRLLRLLTRIPFLGGPDYDPEQPLDASLLQAADGLAPLRPTLVTLETDLHAFSETTGGLQTDLQGLDRSLERTGSGLSDFRSELSRAVEKLVQASDLLAGLQAKLPTAAWILGLGASLMSIWAALLNLLLIDRGRRLIRAKKIKGER